VLSKALSLRAELEVIPIHPKTMEKGGSAAAVELVKLVEDRIIGYQLKVGSIPCIGYRIIQRRAFIVDRLAIGTAECQSGTRELQQPERSMAADQIAFEGGRSWLQRPGSPLCSSEREQQFRRLWLERGRNPAKEAPRKAESAGVHEHQIDVSQRQSRGQKPDIYRQGPGEVVRRALQRSKTDPASQPQFIPHLPLGAAPFGRSQPVPRLRSIGLGLCSLTEA
jgi:hypothetical protein